MSAGAAQGKHYSTLHCMPLHCMLAPCPTPPSPPLPRPAPPGPAGTPLQNNLRELYALLAFMADSSIEAVERRVKVRYAALHCAALRQGMARRLWWTGTGVLAARVGGALRRREGRGRVLGWLAVRHGHVQPLPLPAALRTHSRWGACRGFPL